MLKEVGASGQISLGKRYAGQLFSVEVQSDGAIVMRPVKVVPVHAPVGKVADSVAEYRQADKAWAETHATEIDTYNAWASQREPYSQRVRSWRKNRSDS